MTKSVSCQRDLEYEKAKRLVQNYEHREEENKDYDIMKANKKLIGTYYKYHNSYSSDEYWWLFKEVIGVNGTTLVCREYQTTSHETSEVKDEEHPCYRESGMGYGYAKISKKEFVKGRDSVLNKLGLSVK